MPKYLHDTVAKERALEALAELKESLGWELICGWIECANVRAIASMGDNPSMSTDEMHFHRGSISAGTRFPVMVAQIMQHFEAEILLDNAQVTAKLKSKSKTKTKSRR